ncbi:MAG: HDOD domain-containing protein [Gammaproteobacteria bacterium]|jgi:EAL and modified HD-GYP domain-containing signal transduction protein
MDHLYIARQPIYDLNKAVMGYELLYRSSAVNQANIIDANQASCETILNSFMHIGIDTIVGSALAFINLPREFVINDSLTPMFRNQSVLEILEHVEPDEEVIKGLRRLKSEGYRIALDDFSYRDKLIPLVELTDFIKIDVSTVTKTDIEQQVALLKPYNVKLIAEKVETHEAYQDCLDLGFENFQGFFFCYPVMLTRKSLPSNKMVILNILNRLHDPDTGPDELEQILVQDIALSYKLLRYINSAAFALRREVDSVKDAIILLGTDNLKNWVSLIMMSRIIESKPTELIVTGMIRGKMCELLAENEHPEIKHQMFLIGLFSVLDALMDQPLIELLDNVVLSTPIKLALLDKMGIQGELYQRVLHYEKCNWDELNNLNVNTNEYAQSYVNAVTWADQSMKAILNV